MALENSLGFVITLVICVLCIAFETQALVLVVPSLISHFESFIALAGLSDMLPRIAAAPCGLVQQFTMGCPEKSDKYDTSRLEVILVYAAFWLILTSLTNKIVGLFSSGSAPSSSKPLLRALGNLVSASLQATALSLLYVSGDGINSVALKVFLAAQSAQRSSFVVGNFSSASGSAARKHTHFASMHSLAMMMRLVSICLFAFAVERGMEQAPMVPYLIAPILIL